MRTFVGSVAVCIALLSGSTTWAQSRTFESGSLIIPMDLSYQADGMYQAYGLLYQLLRQGIPVAWVIDSNKTWHQAPCNTAGDLCAWDCGEEGSGPCNYPTGSPDFQVSTKVVWSNVGTIPDTAINKHGYRGGPFVVAAANRDAALAIIDVWNNQDLWEANPWAARNTDNFEVVTVHEATESFTGAVAKDMIAAPSIAVFADKNEKIATSYLRAAGIPQSNGNEFPADGCDKVECGPGTENPDMLTVPSVAGDMGTCDEPNFDHKNGALFDASGAPAYCQIMSMHWDVSARNRVLCGDGNCPETPEECAGVPITYHGHEAVAEVRAFLRFPTHFFAECQAVNAYENTVPNPEWPYLDDPGRIGHFLTTTGTPPPCPCDPDPAGGKYECVTDGCGPGADCCLPSEEKEFGAGFLIADKPSDFKVLRPDVPYMQFDGQFVPEGGSEEAYNLSSYLMTAYHNDRDVTFITSVDGPGVQDVWMTGYLDGECDIAEGPVIEANAVGKGAPTYCGGKVSYLGGHSFSNKPGQRLFLNALFEADCVTNPEWPGGAGGGFGDSDGDGVPDGDDEYPNDPNRCGDSDLDTCDDCSQDGFFDPANDGPDSDGDGICDAGENGANGGGDGCGCQTGRGGAPGFLLLGLALVLLFRPRERRRRR